MTGKQKELIRFLICGVIATVIDYLFSQLIILIFKTVFSDTLLIVISTLVGFIFGVIANYLISTYWVYQNVDKSVNTKSLKFKLLFLLFSFLGFVISVLIMLLCNLIITSIWDQSLNIVKVSVLTLMKDYGFTFLAQGIFWSYFVSFILKTLGCLTFNYFTRKYLLYKENNSKNINK